MDMDTRHDALSPQAGFGRTFLQGLLLVPAIAALASNDLAFAVTPGIASIDGHVGELAGDGDVPVYAGSTLADGYSLTAAYVLYYNEAVNKILPLTVEGTPALTGSEAAPTDAEITAALPNSGYRFTVAGTVTFARSGTAITATHERTSRSYDVRTESKATNTADDPVNDGDLYEPGEIIAISVDAADIANADVLTDRPAPLYVGKIGAWRAITEKAITTAAKTATLELQKGATAVDGTSTVYAGTKALGAVTALTAPTAGHATAKFVPGDVFSIVASSVTAFVEGRVRFEIECWRKVIR